MEVYAVGFLHLSLSVLVIFLMPRVRRLVVVWETVTSLINQSLFSEKQITVMQRISPSKRPQHGRIVKPIPMVLRGHAVNYPCSELNVLAGRLIQLEPYPLGKQSTLDIENWMRHHLCLFLHREWWTRAQRVSLLLRDLDARVVTSSVPVPWETIGELLGGHPSLAMHCWDGREKE